MTDAVAPVPADALAASAEEAVLRARKRDLYAAIRALVRDREEGTVDDDVYQRARDRYEREAAAILERLDALASARAGSERGGGSAGTEPQSLQTGPRHAQRFRPAWLAVLIGLGLVVVAVALFLLAAVHGRGSGTITGSLPSPVPAATAVPAPVLAAQRQTRGTPRSVIAWLDLGNAELDAGNPVAADRAFRAAMGLAPDRPQAPTLDALALSAEGKVTAALQLLSRVERDHPTYARAWLTDGLIAARRAPGLPRAIRAWQHFLFLQPHSPVSGEVRASLRKLEQATQGR